MTDFGLSKVGLINSTDDLSGPTVSDILLCEDEPQLSVSEHQKERRKKRSAVGTPDYLAPEILLGTGHGKLHSYLHVACRYFPLARRDSLRLVHPYSSFFVSSRLLHLLSTSYSFIQVQVLTGGLWV